MAWRASPFLWLLLHAFTAAAAAFNSVRLPPTVGINQMLASHACFVHITIALSMLIRVTLQELHARQS